MRARLEDGAIISRATGDGLAGRRVMRTVNTESCYDRASFQCVHRRAAAAPWQTFSGEIYVKVLSDQDRLDLSRAIVAMLDDWGAEAEEQIALLGLPPETKPRALRRYYENTALPSDAAVWERVEHLLGIGEALRTSYPHNAAGGRIWMHQPHRLFDQRPPLRAMVEDGLGGVIAVRAYLDCAWDWNQSGSGRPAT